MLTGKVNDLLTAAEAGEQLGVTSRAVRDWVADGKMRATRVHPEVPNSPWRIRQTEVDRILELRRLDLER